jgi:hypothetical protein
MAPTFIFFDPLTPKNRLFHLPTHEVQKGGLKQQFWGLGARPGPVRCAGETCMVPNPQLGMATGRQQHQGCANQSHGFPLGVNGGQVGPLAAPLLPCQKTPQNPIFGGAPGSARLPPMGVHKENPLAHTTVGMPSCGAYVSLNTIAPLWVQHPHQATLGLGPIFRDHQNRPFWVLLAKVPRIKIRFSGHGRAGGTTLQ